MQPLAAEDFVAMAKVAPEIEGLKATADEWWLGLVGVDKSESYAKHAQRTWPCWRDGFSRPVRATMRFRAVPFTSEEGKSAVAVVLAVPEDDRELWVGWVGGEREQDVIGWVERLNEELRRMYDLWLASGKPGARK